MDYIKKNYSTIIVLGISCIINVVFFNRNNSYVPNSMGNNIVFLILQIIFGLVGITIAQKILDKSLVEENGEIIKEFINNKKSEENFKIIIMFLFVVLAFFIYSVFGLKNF